MEDKSLELLSEDGRRLLEEFRLCQNEEEVQALIERQEKLNESRKNAKIKHLDMTADEFCKKYGLVSIEEIMERNGIL